MYPTKRGRYLSYDFRGVKVYGVGWQKIIDASSTRSFGYCALAHRGEICRLRMAGGKTPIGVFVAGAMRGYGKAYLSKSSKSQILNGS